jgi:uncharacterized membrane protein
MLKRRIKGGIFVTIGYLLSPLSFWNDAFINIPIAYVIGFLFGLLSSSLFLPFMIIGYWITNIVGLVLMHVWAPEVLSKTEGRNKKKFFFKYFIISIIYTLLIIILLKIGLVKFPYEHFN